MNFKGLDDTLIQSTKKNLKNNTIKEEDII